MSRGVVLFAYNNTSVDYVGLAIKSTKLIKKHLNLPVTLVTDSSDWLKKQYPSDIDLFDNIISSVDTSTQKKRFYDGSLNYEMISWKNTTRSTVFELTPYDETLVIDVDYILNSSYLLNLFELTQDVVLFKDSLDLSGWRRSNEFVNISNTSVPFYWATVFCFKKTEKSKLFFDLISFIKTNWQYYRTLYDIDTPTYRNDFAFSIAIHILNGLVCDKFIDTIPGKMYFTLDRDFLFKHSDNSCTFLIEKQNALGEYTLLKTDNLDIHIMNKQSIMRVL
jgi:hypothetical protein